MASPHHQQKMAYPASYPTHIQRPAAPRASYPHQLRHEEHEDEQPHAQPNELLDEDPGEDRVSKMIDDALEMLEGKEKTGIFCICENTCNCRKHCAVAPRGGQCPCACYEGFWENCGLRREQPGQAQEERPVTPRSLSVYSQGSIQANLQGQERQAQTPDNNHASLSTAGTWSVSRAELWARLPAPGPPTPTTSVKSKPVRG